ncbi:MAG: hypothetical protein ACI8TX_003528 [Hyphomicrobiaceae bacterium]|jgi:hypothetical protein
MMCAGVLTAVVWFSSRSRPKYEFETHSRLGIAWRFCAVIGNAFIRSELTINGVSYFIGGAVTLLTSV